MLTWGQERDLEGELLARLIAAGGTSTIVDLFAGYRPDWAYAAADRLEDRGLVAVQEDRATAVTPAGLREHARYEREQAA